MISLSPIISYQNDDLSKSHFCFYSLISFNFHFGFNSSNLNSLNPKIKSFGIIFLFQKFPWIETLYLLVNFQIGFVDKFGFMITNRKNSKINWLFAFADQELLQIAHQLV